MPVIYDIKCDKCGGPAIEHTDPPKYVHEDITMAEYIKLQSRPRYEHAVYYYTHHKLICTKCGHITEYQT